MKNTMRLFLKSLALIVLLHTAGLARLPRLKVDGKYIKDPYVSSFRPSSCSTALIVGLPGARTAPISSNQTCRNTGLENSF